MVELATAGGLLRLGHEKVAQQCLPFRSRGGVISCPGIEGKPCSNAEQYEKYGVEPAHVYNSKESVSRVYT